MERSTQGFTKGAVLGAGSFGTALSAVLAHNGVDVNMWAREEEIVEGIQRDKRNPL